MSWHAEFGDDANDQPRPAKLIGRNDPHLNSRIRCIPAPVESVAELSD